MSFDTTNISCGSVIGTVSISAPTHNVGGVVLTEDAGALNVNALSINTDLLNTDYVVSAVSVTTPLIVGDTGFPVTVENLKTVTLNSGAGTVGQYPSLNADLDLVWVSVDKSVPSLMAVLDSSNDASGRSITNLESLTVSSGAGTDGQVLALDSSLNLVWKDDANTPQGLASVLAVSNDADGGAITNLAVLGLTSGAGTDGQVLALDSSLNLVWKDDASIPQNIEEVLTTGNDANDLSITNLNDVSTKTLSLNNTASWLLSANASTNNLDVSTSTGGYLNLGSITSITTGQQMASLLIGKKPSYDYWVSPNGSNSDAVSNGGSLENPFQTISACVNYCETLTASDNTYRYIHILGGNYAENFTITKKVFLIGEAQSGSGASVGCSIFGTITINVDANGSDMFNNVVTLSGLLLGDTITFESTENSILNVENCYIYTPNDTVGRGIYFNPSSTDSRLRMWNTQIISGGTNGNNSLLELTNKGQLLMNYCYLSAKGLQSCLEFNGTANCDTVANCKFENSSSSSVVPAIVKVDSTTSSTYAFSNCGFIYTSSTNKAGNANASGIKNGSPSGNNTIISSYNQFFLAGTTSANYAIQDANAGGASQMICLFFMNGGTPANASAIRGTLNVNKFQLNIIS